MWSHRLNLFEIFKATTLFLLAVLLFSVGSASHPTSLAAYLSFSAIMILQALEMFAPILPERVREPARRALLLRIGIFLQLILASALVAVTDGSGSIYELVYLLPIISAATKLPGQDVILAVAGATLAMIGFIVTGEQVIPIATHIKEFEDAVAAMVYFAMAGLLVYFFAQGERVERQRYQDLAAVLAIRNVELGTAQAQLKDRLDQVTKMEERLQEVSRMAVLGEMAGQIAHEVRNPLGIIKCSAEMLAARTKDTSTQRHIAVLLEETARVNKAVEGVLRLGAPLRMNKAPVNLSELLNSVVQLSSAWSLSPRVRIEVVAVPPEIIVAGDYDLLHQAFANLVRNACQAMPSTGGVVRISSTIPASGRLVNISIVDSGMGMAEEDLKRLGESFFTTRRGGVGLGFSLARRVIVEHGGELQVASKQGRGTNVLVALPISVNIYAKQLTGAAGQGRD